MKASTLLFNSLLPAAAVAQNITFLTGFLQTLQGAGLTQLATVATQLNSSSVGQYLLANISNGSPHILFAPNNEALSNAPKNITGDLGRLTDVFGYHIVPGNFSNSVTRYPNVTLGRTLLTDPALVHLEGGNKAQVLAWAQRADNRTHVLNQRNDSTVVNVTSFGNLTVFIVDHLLEIPQDFNTTVPTNNESLSAIQTVLGNVQTPIFDATNNQTSNVTLLDAINSQWHGFTFFAPNNDAVQSAMSTIQGLAGNATAVQNVLYNHIINGSTVYSPVLAGQNFTSTAGEDLGFTINSTGQYVTSGNITARIVQPNVLLPNGVIHVIDKVLLNTQADSSAASSAIASATSAAAVTPTETQPIGFSQTQSLNPSGSATGTSGNNSGAITLLPSLDAFVGLGLSVVAALVGGVLTIV
ncbi:hypothetical protein QCA50_008647 [Cerrena zonata]|uniref:FAS1 domain-containing protein n=1 Tax=Cerrena zonata TaxID=2478898 RepID=A0AAW0G9U9_9APHY